MSTKTFKARMKTPGDKGQFEAIFATLGVVDHDGDLTERGAFGMQTTVIEAWNHNYNGLPTGKGRIFERGNEAVFEGHFFLNTESGLEHYKTVKNLGDLQEWSYTFNIIASRPGKGGAKRILEKLDVFGVAPVQRGAGVGTRTVVIKSGAYSRQAVEDLLLDLRLLRVWADLHTRQELAAKQTSALQESLADLRADVLFDVLQERVGPVKPAQPTNLDAIRAAIRAVHPDASAGWVEAMAGIRLEEMICSEGRRRQRGGCDPRQGERDAREAVQAWARRAAAA